MKRTEILRSVAELFKFKIINDYEGNEYVIYEKSNINSVDIIEDKTAFEALENHEHIINNLKKSEIDVACSIGKALGKAQLSCLNQKYPNKAFVVFVTVGEDLIIRFHQKRENEPLYYDVNIRDAAGTEIFMFE